MSLRRGYVIMSVNILFTSFAVFFACLFLHIFWWRIKRPKKQIAVLYAIFYFMPLLFWAGFNLFKNLLQIKAMTAEDIILIYFLHIALSSAYIFTYPAAQAKCPTLSLLLLIKKYMPEGLSRQDLKKEFISSTIFNDRIKDLLEEGLIRNNNGLMQITCSGSYILKIFIILRKIYGLPVGKG